MTGGDSIPSKHDQYVQARTVLLDALEALQAHLDAITLVSAQAIYLWVGESDDLGIPPYTTDADLALNPAVLGPEPEIVETLQAAGFDRQQDPGVWKSLRNTFTVDLLVPAAMGGGGRRAARLPGHGKNAAHKVRGLAGVLVERESKEITALKPGDPRHFNIAVSGPGALLVAKLYKLWERKGNAVREDAKDALDAFRILRAFPTADLSERIIRLRETASSQEEAQQALVYLEELFRGETAYGAQMVGDAIGLLADRDEVILSSVILAQDLLTATVI